MLKKIAAFLLATLLFCGLMAGCGQGKTTYTSIWYSVDDEGDTNSTTRNRTKGEGQTATTAPVGSGVTRPTRKQNEMITFKKVEDKGADYNVKGTVRIAVDTVRPTDYEPMFDIMEQLYPNVTVEYDYWTHSSNDDGREYLIKKMKTGTAADIIWDEAGEMPRYIKEGWVYPITKFVAKDPEAANIPASVKKDYTFFGELYAVPHQATIEIVAINKTLQDMLGLKKPALNWTMEDYEKFLRAGATGFTGGKCVGIYRLFEAYHRYSYYTSNSSAKNTNYGVDGYNYNTKQFEYQWLKLGTDKFRYWRTMLPGVEAYWEATASKAGDGTSALQHNLGISNYLSTWSAGKSLVHDCITWQLKEYDNYNFDWYAWPMPNIDGKMPVHIDQCFITSTCADENINAAFQLLRFMTYTTNGNLARLSMYDDAQKGKYALNSYVYYPVTTNKTVIQKFKDLKCTGEAEVYILESIPRSPRYDNYKLVPEWRSILHDYIGSPANDVTDGLKDGSSMQEPVAKANKKMAEAWKDFETETKKVQAAFNAKHK